MNRILASKSHAVCAALVLAAGTATTASAVDKHWLSASNNSAWSTASNWSPVGQPGALDNVNIGNVAGVQNTTVLLDINEAVNNLNITDGMTLDTNVHTLNVNLEIELSGRNTVGNSVFPSRLRVDQIINGPEVTAGIFSILDEAEIELNGGGLLAENFISIGADSSLRGVGTVDFASNSINLRNDGVIAPGNGPLHFRQAGSGAFDIDGGFGGGDLDLTASSNSMLTFEGDRIHEDFGATLSMIRGTRLEMDLAQPWGVEATGVFNIYGSGTGTAAARITGAPMNFGGTINLYGGSVFSIVSGVTFEAGSELITGLNAAADIAGDAIINGGLFTINEGSILEFNGATTVNGGTFITFSDESTTGSVDFNGPTEWDGNIGVTGFARQNGPAHVTGPTVISGDTFDMDGSNDADWDLDANLTLNVDRIDFSGNEFNTTMNIGAGRIAVNVPAPAASA